MIPGLVDSRKCGGKKIYFFGSQEFTDDARPTSTTRANLPTALERNGDFSQTRITNGTIQPIIDPLTGAAVPGQPDSGRGDAGCGVQFSCIDPLGQRMLRILPRSRTAS